MNMTASPPATARGKLNCDPLQKIAHLGEDAKSAQKRNPLSAPTLTCRLGASIPAVAVIAVRTTSTAAS